MLRRTLKEDAEGPPCLSNATPFRWYGLAVTIVLMDHATKFAIADHLAYGEALRMTSFFNLVHFRNHGAAFGLLADAGGWQRAFLVVVALAVTAWLVRMLRRDLPSVEPLGYSLVLGGALGNLLDRVLRGSVVDYLDIHWRNLHWPAFNLADVAITLGVIGILGSTLGSQQPGDRNHAAG